MLAASLSTDVWLGVGFIAAITVVTCLAVIANILRYELEFIRVVASVKRLRDKLIQQIDVAEVQDGNEANPATGRPEMNESPTPTPGSDGSTESEEIMVIPPDTEPDTEPNSDAEPAATDAAQAA